MTHEILDAPLGDVATRVLHEDDRLKIWELDLAPGEETAPHRHEHDYILVVIEGDRITGVTHVESTGDSAVWIDADVEPGSVYVLEKGGVEAARNTGSKRFREILIELKK